MENFSEVSIRQPFIFKLEFLEGAFAKDLPLVFVLFAFHNDYFDAFFVLYIKNEDRHLSMRGVLLFSTLKRGGVVLSFGPVNIYV